MSLAGQHFDPERFEWGLMRPYGLLNHCVKPPKGRQGFTCGKIVAHAMAQISSFRESKGIRLCVFKIGVTSNPPQRFTSYLGQGYDTMWVITTSHSVDLIHMLEAACIHHYSPHVGCRNAGQSGGEGALNRVSHPDPPFYLYVVGARADQAKSIG